MKIKSIEWDNDYALVNGMIIGYILPFRPDRKSKAHIYGFLEVCYAVKSPRFIGNATARKRAHKWVEAEYARQVKEFARLYMEK